MRNLSMALLLSLISLSAQAVTIDFEEFAPLTSGPVESNGYKLFTDKGALVDSAAGTDGNMFACNAGCEFTVENIADELFNLNSIEIYGVSAEGYTATVSLYGSFGPGYGGDQTVVQELTLDADGEMITFTPNWTGLYYFEVRAFFCITDGSCFTGFGLDNIDVTTVSAVPVPAAVWLFGSALAAIGFRRRN